MLSIEDRLAILDLAARYSHALDYGDPEAYADTFTEDGVFEGPGAEPVRGRAALVAMARRAAARRLGARHFTSNPVVDGEGDRATLRLYLVVVRPASDGDRIGFTGRYEDDLRRAAGVWKFTRRRAIPNNP